MSDAPKPLQLVVKAPIPWWHHVAIAIGLVASCATVYTTYRLVKKTR